MQLDIVGIKINRENDLEILRSMAISLLKCIGSDSRGNGYDVINDHNPPRAMFSGSRDQCLAFIEGFESSRNIEPDTLCVCVDCPSHMIVIPEERFGEGLGG